MPTRLTIVFLPDFSHELPDAAQSTHVWLIETPANLRAAESCWKLTESSRDRGVTVFEWLDARSAEEWLAENLSVINDHHGLQPDWEHDVEVTVLGAPLTVGVSTAFEVVGQFEYNNYVSMFVARHGESA
jgi:hypothetical protein